MMKRNEELIKIPAFMFETLLQAYYFQKACEYYNIEHWENYEDAMLYKSQLAVRDIMNDNKE